MFKKYILLLALSALIGALSGMINSIFGHVLLIVSSIRIEYIYYLVPFLGVVGILIVLCYQRFGKSTEKGMFWVFKGDKSPIPLRLIPFSMAATWLTQLFGGSAGREGVGIQIGSTLASWFSYKINGLQDYRKILLITGIAAGFAGLFRTPLTATFFALEVLVISEFEIKAVIPSLLAAYAASFVSGFLGLERFSYNLQVSLFFSWGLLLKLIILGIIFGLTGYLFSVSLYKFKKLLAKFFKSPIWRVFLIGLLISIFTLLCWEGRYSGLGVNLIEMSFTQGIYPWDFAFKIIFTVLTLSAGFQGGEVTPLFSIGASLGVVLASLLGLPVPLVAALGYVAVFGSATNTLIAPMILGAEVFGFEYLPYFIIVSVIAYLCNRNLSIYPLQKNKTLR